MTIKEIVVEKLLTVVLIVMLVLVGYAVLTKVLCKSKVESYNYTNTSTIFEDNPIIIPDTLPYWSTPDSIIPVSEVVASTNEGDEAHIVITFDPENEVTVVSGTINDNPITEANVQIIDPITPTVYQEEFGNISVLLHQSITSPQTALVGLSYEPLILSHGRVRFGVQGAVNASEWNNGMIGGRVAYRKGNIGVGIGIGTEIPSFELNVGVGVGFYL